jgi:hypothetical protein
LKSYNFIKDYIFGILLPVLTLLNSTQLYPQNLSSENKKKLKTLTYFLSDQEIKYGKKFTPPGKKGSIKMDCSNTVKYTYKEALGILLPRTSYEQYQLVKSKGNFQTPLRTEEGKIDILLLKKNMKIGDLLFWINTHSDIPKTWNPPIGHVMIYMGTSKTKKMVMFGAGTYGDGFKTTTGGVDLYLFDPEMSLGCVKNKNKECVVESEFFGYGKPPIE